MARRNGTPTAEQFIGDLFEDWSDDRLAEFVYDSRSFALDSLLSASLSDAADIAGKLAEAELEQRESQRREIEAAYRAEVNAWYASQREAAVLEEVA